MSDVTHLLGAIEQGDLKAADELLPLFYDELRRLAACAILFGTQATAKQPKTKNL